MVQRSVKSTPSKRKSRAAHQLPCALTIAGLDPGGGAGIAADLRGFARAGVFGCAALAVTTVQSTDGLKSVVPMAAKLVVEQAAEVLAHQTVRAIKLGALGSRANVAAVATFLEQAQRLPLVVDPVMVPSRGGARLLDAAALRIFRERLLPLATLVTANVPEAEALVGERITRPVQARAAARRMVEMGAHAAMVKGGHLHGKQCIDYVAFADGRETELVGERLPIRTRIHGGGCTLAALAAGRLAAGDDLDQALQFAKTVLHEALGRLADVGGHLRVLPLAMQ